MVIKDEIKLDETTSYYKNSNKNFYDDFVSFGYNYNLHSGVNAGDDNYNVTLTKNVTPPGLKDVKIYEVSGTMETAVKINMMIRIRNRLYTIEVK